MTSPPLGRILVVEDDTPLRNALVSTVQAAGYEVVAVGDGAPAVQALHSSKYEVILLDIGLPFVDGWRVLKSLEGPRQPPVIIISARGETEDKICSLDMGADDYLAKPFEAAELLARIRAVLRRRQSDVGPPAIVPCAGVTVDLGARTVFKNGGEVRLSPTEYVLLAELARHAGQVLDHRTLLQRVRGRVTATNEITCAPLCSGCE